MPVTQIITLNQIVNWFSQFAQNHQFLKDFGWGETYDIGNSRQMLFPYMWLTLNDNSTIITSNATTIPTFSFSVMFMDKMNDQPNYLDENGFQSNNSQEILSDCVQYLQDLVIEIQQTWQPYGVFFDSDVSFFPVIDETPDKSTGIVANLLLKTKFVNCVIPVSIPVSPTPTPTNTITPTVTPTITPTPTPTTTYQYFTGQITGATTQEILVSCWNTTWNVNPGNNLCNWTASMDITGSTGTIVPQTFTFPIGQPTYTIDYSSGLLPGETIVARSIFYNVSIPCPNYSPQFL